MAVFSKIMPYLVYLTKMGCLLSRIALYSSVRPSRPSTDMHREP